MTRDGNGNDYLMLAQKHLTAGLAHVEAYPGLPECKAHAGTSELLRGLAYDRMSAIEAKLLARQIGEVPVVATGRKPVFPLGSFKLGNLCNAQGVVGLIGLLFLVALLITTWQNARRLNDAERLLSVVVGKVAKP